MPPFATQYRLSWSAATWNGWPLDSEDVRPLGEARPLGLARRFAGAALEAALKEKGCWAMGKCRDTSPVPTRLEYVAPAAYSKKAEAIGLPGHAPYPRWLLVNKANGRVLLCCTAIPV